MVEVWCKVPGYEDYYKVSNRGRVKSVDRVVDHPHWGAVHRKSKMLKPAKDGSGYLHVVLCKDGRHMHRVHRLVMAAFVGQCPEGMEVNHIDEDKTNNRLDNLEYVTPQQNINHGTRNDRAAKARSKPVRQLTLNGNLVSKYRSITEAEIQTGVDNRYISKCCKGKQKTAGGYRWEYV